MPEETKWLIDKFAADDRSFLEWCRTTAQELPASRGFYLWLAAEVEERIRQHDEATA